MFVYIYYCHRVFQNTCVLTDAPLVSIPPVNTRISAGDTTNIYCRSDSKPLSDITWSIDGKEFTVCRSSGICPVSVGNVGSGQQVNYMCIAKNDYGRDMINITFEGQGTYSNVPDKKVTLQMLLFLE